MEKTRCGYIIAHLWDTLQASCLYIASLTSNIIHSDPQINPGQKRENSYPTGAKNVWRYWVMSPPHLGVVEKKINPYLDEFSPNLNVSPQFSTSYPHIYAGRRRFDFGQPPIYRGKKEVE